MLKSLNEAPFFSSSLLVFSPLRRLSLSLSRFGSVSSRARTWQHLDDVKQAGRFTVYLVAGMMDISYT